MALTIEAVLKLEVFHRVPWKVYAGAHHLSRTVRWVHPNEVPDISRFLKGGEMLLTAGTGIGHTAKEQRGYLRAISAAGAAVLVIELSGRAFATMPEALVDEAEQLGFPLVGLDGEIPFVEASAQVHERLVDQRVVELAAYERLNNSFMELLLTGQDYVAFSQALSKEIRQPVVLEDSSRRVLAHTASTPASDAEVREWDQHSRIRHDHDSLRTVLRLAPRKDNPDQSPALECTRRAIAIRGERWGWLHVIHEPDALGAADVHALERTADAVAISILSARESGARAAQRENALINRLLLGDISGDAFITRSLRLGKDLRGRQLVAVWAMRTSLGKAAQEQLADVTDDLDLTAVVADIGDHAVAVVGLVRASELTRLVDRLGANGPTSGVSRLSQPQDLGTALRQARSAASVATSRRSTRAVQFDDLGVLRLLISLAEGPELANYVEDELGAVLRHDAKSSHPLLPTLRAYIDCDGNKSRTADALFIQRRTLYYRLERLNGLLHQALEEPNVRQNLSFALRALDLLQGQDPASHTAQDV